MCITFCLTLRRVICSKTDMALGAAAGSGPLEGAERRSVLLVVVVRIPARTPLSCSEAVVVISATIAAETLCAALRRGLSDAAAAAAGFAGGGIGEPNGDVDALVAGVSGSAAAAGSSKGVVGAYVKE